ncbi:hypothetical protein NDU88_006202, partial [Pleurodeles waltl]
PSSFCNISPAVHPLRAASLQSAREGRRNLPWSEGVTPLYPQAPPATTTGCVDLLSSRAAWILHHGWWSRVVLSASYPTLVE